MSQMWADVGCTTHLPAGIVDSLAVEPVYESLLVFMKGVVQQAKDGSTDAQLACNGHEDGMMPISIC